MKKPLILAAIFAVALFGASCSSSSTTNTNTVSTVTNTSSAVSYAGQDGKTALELLAQTHTIDATTEGFINAIDGQKPEGRQFWAFYVNGAQASVGAKDYTTKTGDQIEWRLEAY